MVDRVEPTVWGQRPDPADRVEAMARRTSSSVVDRLGPTVRDHSAELVGRVAMADREASVVRVERAGMLEVEVEVEHDDEDAEDSVAFHGRKTHLFSLWLGTYRWMCGFSGGGCREVFRPWVETERSKRKWHVQRLHMYVGYVDKREKGGGIYPTL